jgi:hypothetical protein
VDPVPDPPFFFVVVPGIEPGPLDHRGGHQKRSVSLSVVAGQRLSRHVPVAPRNNGTIVGHVVFPADDVVSKRNTSQDLF